MSLFKYLFDTDWLQRQDLERLEERAELLEAGVWATSDENRTVEAQLGELRKDVSRMLLMLETVQRVLADKGICSEQDFVHRMKAIDAEDGIEDGQLSRGSAQDAELRYCDGCQHFNSARLQACLYCGRLFGPVTNAS